MKRLKRLFRIVIAADECLICEGVVYDKQNKKKPNTVVVCGKSKFMLLLASLHLIYVHLLHLNNYLNSKCHLRCVWFETVLTSVLLILSSPTSFFLAREMRDRGAPLSRSLSLPRSVYVLLGDRPGGDLSVSVYIKLERERGRRWRWPSISWYCHSSAQPSLAPAAVANTHRCLLPHSTAPRGPSSFALEGCCWYLLSVLMPFCLWLGRVKGRLQTVHLVSMNDD